MAEVHIIGQIDRGTGFPKKRLFCRWSVHYGGGWSIVGGLKEGQTQTDCPTVHDTPHFAHPIDIHLETRTIQGWPKVHAEVWHQDDFGRQEIYGYGFFNVPTQPGYHTIHCLTWKPSGSLREELLQRFVGGGLQLRSSSVLGGGVAGSGNSNNVVVHGTDRFKLTTVPMGSVHFNLSIILRNFDKFGIQS